MNTKSKNAAPRRRVLLSVEALEDRLAPAVFWVNNLNDAGAGSLRQAILDLNQSADFNNSINFIGPNGTITLNSALDGIQNNVSINGPGANNLTVQRSIAQNTPDFRIFYVWPLLNVTISGLKISNGKAPAQQEGGGIRAWGDNLTLRDVIVDGNTGHLGGGVYVWRGTATITASRFTNNTSGALGGGLHIDEATVTISNTNFINNTAASGGGAIESQGSLTITGGIISNNSTGAGGNGGGVYVSGPGSLTVQNRTTISNNSAGFGGGVSFSGTDLLISDHVIISSNTAQMFGGGVSIAATQNARILNRVTISGNTATNGDGGGIHNRSFANVNSRIDGAIVSGNQASGSGGGLNHSGGQLTLTNSTFSGNAAATGGGVRWFGPPRPVMRNNTITNNRAGNIFPAPPAGGGGGGGGGGLFQGGGLFNDDGNGADIANSIVAGNFSDDDLSPDVFGEFDSQGHNLIGDGSGSSGWIASDMVGTPEYPIDPMLGDLGDYGGGVETHILLEGSPALDAGDNALVVDAVDQRGFARIVNGTVDIGAVEMTVDGTITGIAWDDFNQDGIQDAGEMGLGGITVQLFDEFDALIATMQTAEDGLYVFQGLQEGYFYLVFVKPGGMEFTLPDQGYDDTLDSDVVDPVAGKTA